MSRILFKNGQVFYNNQLSKLDVLVEQDTIVDIKEEINDTNAVVIDLEHKLLSHGFVDIHTHLREPGFTHKETVKTGSLSGLYGGYSHIVAMANTNPCMDHIDTIDLLEKIIEKDACIHTYTYSAITKGLAGKQLVDMETNLTSPIILGFSDDGKGVQSSLMMESAMKEAKRLNSIIVAHCEDESELKLGGCLHDGYYAKEHGLVGINSDSEFKQVARDLKLVKQIQNRYHVCHVSTKETVDLLRQAQLEGLNVTGEASPHHLVLTEDNIQNCDPNYKMNPPLRSFEDRQALIRGLNEGVLPVIATDHAPHASDEKAKPIDKAPFGIIGLQHCFPLVYTYVVKSGEVKLETVLQALTTNPGRVLGLDTDLKIGQKANICVFDLEEEFTIQKEDIVSLSSNTPFIGYRCFGKIKYNMIDGKLYQF